MRAQRLEDAVQADVPDAPGDADTDPVAETAAERAEDDGYPLGRSGDATSR